MKEMKKGEKNETLSSFNERETNFVRNVLKMIIKK